MSLKYIDEKDNVQIEINGHVVYKDNKAGKDSVKQILFDYISAGIDYNKIWGSYRVIIKDKDKTIIFGDNSGAMCFYYNQNSYSSSFLDIVRTTKNLTENYDAISQFVLLGCVHGEETYFNEIRKTDFDYYYVFKRNGVEKISKQLLPYDQLNNFKSLKDIVCRLADNDYKKGCVVTGGLDSRMILSYLTYGQNNKDIVMLISGDKNHIDVKISKEISETLDLNWLHSEKLEADNINTCFEISDGMSSFTDISRLINFWEMIKDNDVKLVFGGLAGELYKNNFIDQDFPFYFGKPNIDFLVNKIVRWNFPSCLQGSKIENSINCLKSNLIDQFKVVKIKSKSRFYLTIGRKIMFYKAIGLCNIANKFCCFMNPLMERDAMSFVYSTNPYKLEMGRFQRKEISKYGKRICKIKTDQGQICNFNLLKEIKFLYKYFVYHIKIWVRRYLPRNNFDNLRKDYDYSKIKSSREYIEAIDRIKNKNILPKNIHIDDIPDNLVGRYLTLGMVLNLASKK